jgi:predicted DNA-binding ribbon-helix-helix protein
MRLEPEVWDALREICLREGIELRDLIRTVERTATAGGRTSAVRVHVLQYFRAAATNEGHIQAGHGTTTVTGPAPVLSEMDMVGNGTVTPSTSLPIMSDIEVDNALEA